MANTAQSIAALGVEGLKGYIKTIGLYNNKAVNVVKACEILVEKYDGEVPENREALEALPGVGRKTANVVLNTALRLAYHCGRYSHRQSVKTALSSQWARML